LLVDLILETNNHRSEIWGKCPRLDTHLTYMIDIALTTERKDCHRGDRGKHDYGEPLGGRCDRARSREDREERGVGWNAERGSG
jgi:hypothetical protein